MMAATQGIGGSEGPRRVFVVEDHARLRHLIETYLAIQGDLVCCGSAKSAEEALPLLAAADPDLLMADLSLPGMSGIDLIQQVVLDRPAMICLILSGHKESRYARLALAAGARGYVLKGNPDAIADALRRCSRGETVVSEELDADD